MVLVSMNVWSSGGIDSIFEKELGRENEDGRQDDDELIMQIIGMCWI